MKDIKIAALLIVILFACKKEELDHGDLEVSRLEGNIQLHNTSKAILYYELKDLKLEHEDWDPTLEDHKSIDTGRSRIVSLDSIQGYTDSSFGILVYRWKAIKRDGQWIPGPVQSSALPLGAHEE